MAIDKLKVMLSFMREINDNNIPTAGDYELEHAEFYNILDMCQDEGLIKGAIFARGGRGNKIIMAYLDNVTLTVKGLEYLHQNSGAMQTYRGLKEIREWLPFQCCLCF